MVDVVGGSHFLNEGLRKQEYVNGAGSLIHQTFNETIARGCPDLATDSDEAFSFARPQRIRIGAVRILLLRATVSKCNK